MILDSTEELRLLIRVGGGAVVPKSAQSGLIMIESESGGNA
jgi:hypothetical protein